MTAIGGPLPGPKLGPGLKKKRNRQLLIYGGVGVALLLLIVLRSRSSAANSAAPADASQVVPVSSPAVDGALGSGGGVDNSSQLAGFESDLLNQLPQVVSSGIAAGFANMPVGTVPAGGASGSGDFATAVTTAASLISMGMGMAGQQTGGSSAAAKSASAGAGKTKATIHPALTTPAAIGQGALTSGTPGTAGATYHNTSASPRAGSDYRVETRKVGGVPHIVHVYVNGPQRGHVIDMGKAH